MIIIWAGPVISESFVLELTFRLILSTCSELILRLKWCNSVRDFKWKCLCKLVLGCYLEEEPAELL